MNRSKLRHALYRAKNGIFAPEKQYIYDMVEHLIPINESWATFSENWDIFYKDGEVVVVRPEIDYDFIHSTCLEKSVHIKNNIPMETTNRQLNAIQIVELNMLEGKMEWETYNKKWGVSVDIDLKRIHTRLFGTSVNRVTVDMIKASAPSDGAAMTAPPEIPVAVMDKSVSMTDEEIKKFNAYLAKKDKKHKKKF